MWCWSEQHLVLLCFLCTGEEIGKDSMKPHPEGSEEPMHVQALLQLWSPPCLRPRAQRSFEHEAVFRKASWRAWAVYWELCQWQVSKGPVQEQSIFPAGRTSQECNWEWCCPAKSNWSHWESNMGSQRLLRSPKPPQDLLGIGWIKPTSTL